ncbi:SRPBCC family protein [Micromonospora sp. LOL_023]|uniref:SRPBCC family protein n=1 Tax=Micromonospora sp. LOL_023 TaxID=3345418 RepID=UPI003A898C62
MIDIKQQINDVRRAVGSRVLEAGEARVVTVSQTYRGDLADVWDACTNAERIPRWFLPISGELRLGGHYQLEGNASGTVERCDPPHGFAATWEFGGQVSWIEVHLTEQPAGQVELTLEHVAHIDDELWAQFGPGAAGMGWDGALLGLAIHLSGAPPLTPAEAVAWMGSDEGRQFNTLSSEQWYGASVAAGTPAAEARAAADRCLAAYTGVEPPPADGPRPDPV